MLLCGHAPSDEASVEYIQVLRGARIIYACKLPKQVLGYSNHRVGAIIQHMVCPSWWDTLLDCLIVASTRYIRMNLCRADLDKMNWLRSSGGPEGQGSSFLHQSWDNNPEENSKIPSAQLYIIA